MLTFKHIAMADYKSQPWRNGLGVTREIAVDPKTPFLWRLSWADLAASGPFSEFPGYQRQVVLLTGEVQFKHGNKFPRALTIFNVHNFSGDDATFCEVMNPAQDFNLFCLKGKTRGNCYPTDFKDGEEMHLPLRGHEHFLFVATGQIEVHDRANDKKVLLGTQDTAWLSRPANEEFLDVKTVAKEPSRAIWVVIHYL